MDINEKNSVENVNEEDFSEVAGGRKVNFFGMPSETGSYSKCDFCGKYGTMPLVNGQDCCLKCLKRMKDLVGENNVIKLLLPQNGPEPSTKNIPITTTPDKK